MTTTQRFDDRGAALPIVLVLVLVMGAVLAALLTQGATHFKATATFDDRRDGTYAADAGIEHALAAATAVDETPGTPAPQQCTDPIRFRNTEWAKNASDSSTLTLTGFDLNEGPGRNRLILAAVSHEGNKTVSTLTFGGKAMTRANGRTQGTTSGSTTEVWYLLDDPTLAAGSHNVVMTASAADRFALHVSSWTGAAQSAPATATGSSTANVKTITTSLNSAPVGLLLSAASTSASGTDVATGTGAGTRLAGDQTSEAPDSASMSTTYRMTTSVANQSVSESFAQNVNPATHVLLGIGRGSRTCPFKPELDAVASALGKANGNGLNVNVDIGYPTGGNRLVIAIVGVEANVTDAQVSVTIGGAAMTQAARRPSPITGSPTNVLEVWYALDANPGIATTGATEVKVSGTNHDYAVHVSSWTGITQAAPTSVLLGGASTSNQGSVTTGPATVSAADTLVFSAASYAEQNAFTGTGAGIRLSGSTTAEPHPNSASLGSSYVVTGANTTVLEDWTGTTNRSMHVLMGFPAAGEPPPATPAVPAHAACPDPPITSFQLNGHTIQVACQEEDDETVTIVATATHGDGSIVTITATAAAEAEQVVLSSWRTG